MNSLFPFIPPAVRADIRAAAKAAHTFSRLSVQYHNWHREALLQGQPHAAERWGAESRRLRQQARDYLFAAQRRKDSRVPYQG